MPLHQNDRLGTVEHWKYFFHYDPNTGFIYRRLRMGPAKAGSRADHHIGRGYRAVSLSRQPLAAHRLAWALVHGIWPDGVVDHINGDPSDNRIVNLRCVSQSQNIIASCERRRGRKDSLGIRFKKGAWESYIKTNGKERYLGRFKTKEAAQKMYDREAAIRMAAMPEALKTEAVPPSQPIVLQPTKAMLRKPLTAERLREIVHYDPETGIMVRRISFSGHANNTGKPIGNPNEEGYLRVKVDGPNGYAVHRLAWLYMTGEWPKGPVDHINRQPADNRWANLRVVTSSENMRNRRNWRQWKVLPYLHRRKLAREKAAT